MTWFRGRKGDEIGPKTFFAADERGSNHLATNARDLTRIEKTAAKENQPQRYQRRGATTKDQKPPTFATLEGRLRHGEHGEDQNQFTTKTNINHSAAEPQPDPFCR